MDLSGQCAALAKAPLATCSAEQCLECGPAMLLLLLLLIPMHAEANMLLNMLLWVPCSPVAVTVMTLGSLALAGPSGWNEATESLRGNPKARGVIA
jgi:hypothetical protein